MTKLDRALILLQEWAAVSLLSRNFSIQMLPDGYFSAELTVFGMVEDAHFKTIFTTVDQNPIKAAKRVIRAQEQRS